MIASPFEFYMSWIGDVIHGLITQADKTANQTASSDWAKQ
jgi:hypothetical protein